MKFKALTLCLLIPCAAFGEIYKWVDDKGQVHYGENPAGAAPEKIIIPEQDIKPRAVTTDEKQRLENVKKWVDARQQEREKEKQLKAELKEKREVRKKKCNKLSRELKDMEEGGIAWYRLDEAGNRQYYSDEEIDARKQEMRETLKNSCR